jgi:hypothetical protein
MAGQLETDPRFYVEVHARTWAVTLEARTYTLTPVAVAAVTPDARTWAITLPVRTYEVNA